MAQFTVLHVHSFCASCVSLVIRFLYPASHYVPAADAVLEPADIAKRLLTFSDLIADPLLWVGAFQGARRSGRGAKATVFHALSAHSTCSS
jgi:hypothetical protein